MIIASVTRNSNEHDAAEKEEHSSNTPSLAASKAMSSKLSLQEVANQRISYPAFRESFFYDSKVNPVLKERGWEPDRMSCVRESKHFWTGKGPTISARLPKTATTPGTAFRNECFSADRLYSTNIKSMGYEAHKSLRGSSLCSSTARFENRTRTPTSVGPGSYNVGTKAQRPTKPKTTVESESTGVVASRDRLKEWGVGPPDSREMDSGDEWKTTSEIPSPTAFSFRKAGSATWIEQIEQRCHKFDPEARHFAPTPVKSSAEQRLPNFLQGTRNPMHTKHSALLEASTSLTRPRPRATLSRSNENSG